MIAFIDINEWLSLCSRVAYKECERCIACQVRQAKQRGGTRSVPPAGRSASALLAACRKRPFFSTFPVFVPSLSWQIDRFWHSNGSKEAFTRTGGGQQDPRSLAQHPSVARLQRCNRMDVTRHALQEVIGAAAVVSHAGEPRKRGVGSRECLPLWEKTVLFGEIPYVCPKPVLVK